MLTVIATLSSENSDAERLLTELENLQQSSRQEVGCLRYELRSEEHTSELQSR